MPELPDIVVYVECLQKRIREAKLVDSRISSPFVLRTFDPEISALNGRNVNRIGRLGKQIVLDFGDEHYLVFHLMIAGRFRWESDPKNPPAKISLAQFHFETGTLTLTEAASKKRASIHVLSRLAQLQEFDADGLELLPRRETHVFELDHKPAKLPSLQSAFTERLRAGNHTLKRALTSPRNFSGIGNAYSDEILHAARLSPVQLTSKLTESQIEALFGATISTLSNSVARLREQFDGRFPGAGEITAFRPEFAVHGKFGKPCPICGTAIQRIRYAENETNYCPACQTGGKILADRSLSRLLREDWPKTIEELERLR